MLRSLHKRLLMGSKFPPNFKPALQELLWKFFTLPYPVRTSCLYLEAPGTLVFIHYHGNMDYDLVDSYTNFLAC